MHTQTHRDNLVKGASAQILTLEANYVRIGENCAKTIKKPFKHTSGKLAAILPTRSSGSKELSVCTETTIVRRAAAMNEELCRKEKKNPHTTLVHRVLFLYTCYVA